MGQLHVQQVNHVEAIEAFEAALRIASDAGQKSRPDLNHNLGVALKRAGRSEEASRALARAVSGYREELRGNSQSASLHFALGSVYVEMREFHNATESFRRAVASTPRDFQARMHLVESLEVQGRLVEALEALNTGVDDMLRLRQEESARALQRYRDSLQSRTERDRNGAR
jgi:tetratricopeptide (TPR) repeat protein